MVSSGEDAPSSRNVRPSTRSHRGRQGSGQSPRSASPARTRRADAAQESSESGSPESEALDGGSHHSRGLSVPNEEHPKLPSPREEGAPSDSGARWQRQPASAASEEHQRPAQPRPVVAHRMGTPPSRRTDSSSAKMRLEQARRRRTAARETTLWRRRRLELNQRRVDDAERAEQETSAELRSAEWGAGQHARASDSVAVATSPSPVRAQPVHSRSDRLGDKAFMDGSVSFMASAGRHEFTTEMRTAVCLLYTSPSPRD